MLRSSLSGMGIATQLSADFQKPLLVVLTKKSIGNAPWAIPGKPLPETDGKAKAARFVQAKKCLPDLMICNPSHLLLQKNGIQIEIAISFRPKLPKVLTNGYGGSAKPAVMNGKLPWLIVCVELVALFAER